MHNKNTHEEWHTVIIFSSQTMNTLKLVTLSLWHSSLWHSALHKLQTYWIKSISGSNNVPIYVGVLAENPGQFKLVLTLNTYYSLSTSVRGQGPWSLLVACAYISCPHILTISCCSPPRDVQHKMHIYDFDVRGLECNLKTQVGFGGEMVIGSSTSFAWSFSKRERW